MSEITVAQSSFKLKEEPPYKPDPVVLSNGSPSI